MGHGRIVALYLCLAHRQPMVPVHEAEAVSDLGLAGDRHAKEGSARQVLFMDVETLRAFGLKPGMVKENVTVEGLDLASLRRGQVLFVGDEVTLEVTGACLPCERMDEIRPGLRAELEGRRGVLGVVLNGGVLRVGDPVRVEPSVEALVREEAGREIGTKV